MKKGEIIFALLMILVVISIPLLIALWANHVLLGEI
jgi:hypothetical protein